MTRKFKPVVSPGRRFFDEQLALLQQAKADELIDKHYHNDAVLISTTQVVKGQAALKKHFHAYMTVLAKIEMVSLEALIEADDVILVEATMRTALGEAKTYDAFVLKDGKITHHFTGVR
jgi:ketosteroid isomerase-like protein